MDFFTYRDNRLHAEEIDLGELAGFSALRHTEIVHRGEWREGKYPAEIKKYRADLHLSSGRHGPGLAPPWQRPLFHFLLAVRPHHHQAQVPR